MPKSIDLSRRATIGARPVRTVSVRSAQAKRAEAARDIYRDAAWQKARRFVFRLHGRVCMYCGARAEVVDHWQPVSTGIDPLQLDNLVPACHRCNTRLGRDFDAVDGIHGNTRPGKPDPRDAEFLYRVEDAAEDYQLAIATRRRSKVTRPPPGWVGCA